jgi:hypothetical protein
VLVVEIVGRRDHSVIEAFVASLIAPDQQDPERRGSKA